MDVGDKSIDTGVDAAWFRAKQKCARRNEIRQDLQIRNSPRIDAVRLIASDALVMVALEIVFSRLIQSVFAYARMGSQDFIPAERPEFRIARARIRDNQIEAIKHPPEQM